MTSDSTAFEKKKEAVIDPCPVERVRSFLRSEGFPDEVMTSEETIFTVDDAARVVGAPSEQILKSLVLLVDGNPVLALMSGVNQVDTKKVRILAEAKKVRMADPGFVFDWSGFQVGGVPPVGYPESVPAYLDEDLFLFPVVWAAAGSDHAFFPVSPKDLKRLTGGMKCSIKRKRK